MPRVSSLSLMLLPVLFRCLLGWWLGLDRRQTHGRGEREGRGLGGWRSSED